MHVARATAETQQTVSTGSKHSEWDNRYTNCHLKGTEQAVAMEAIIATSDWVMGQVQLHTTAEDKIQL